MSLSHFLQFTSCSEVSFPSFKNNFVILNFSKLESLTLVCINIFLVALLVEFLLFVLVKLFWGEGVRGSVQQWREERVVGTGSAQSRVIDDVPSIHLISEHTCSVSHVDRVKAFTNCLTRVLIQKNPVLMFLYNETVLISRLTDPLSSHRFWM